MGTKRDKNYCRSCADDWYPRGQDLSDRCPTCKSTDVTFYSLKDRPRPSLDYVAPAPAPVQHYAPAWQPAHRVARPLGSQGGTSFLIAVAVGIVLMGVGGILYALSGATSEPATPKKAEPVRPASAVSAAAVVTTARAPAPPPPATTAPAWQPRPDPAPPAAAPAAVGCSQCTCRDGACGCCGRGCCSSHGGISR